RLVDSGAAIARRTAWLLEHEAPDAKSTDANIAYCMAMTPGAEARFQRFSTSSSNKCVKSSPPR
ncbi:hypothetical protein ONJ45_25670, partial [Salmonella enterica subsp. enterica serovar Virginia]|nr:hypothetical protein [Salmonella enterica subsp. enterica serovar Virginia]